MGKSWIVEMLLWCFSSCGTFASTAFCFIGKVKPKDYNISVHEQNKEHIYAHNWRTFERQYWRLFYCSLSIQCTCTKIWAPSPAHTHLFDLSSVINDKYSFMFWHLTNCIDGVLASVLASNVIDRGLEPRSRQTNDYKYKIGFSCFTA